MILTLNFISASIIALPLIVGVLFLFRLSNSTKLFFTYVVINLLIQLGLKILANYSNNNVWLVNVSAITDLVFCLVFINYFYFKLSHKKIISVSLISTVLIVIINSFLGWGSIVKSTFIGAELLSLIMVLTGLLHLTKQKGNTPSFYFWILIPLSLYFSVSILVFLAMELGIENSNQNLFVFYLYLFPIVNILAYCCYAIAFFLDARPKLNPRN
tara:strand:- start:6039 stop:6680 length:642 start_codon:yes stop_codon:yes gene_type:complete